MKANGTNNGCSRLNTPLAATTTLEDPGTPASWKGPPPGSEASPFTPNSVGQGGGPQSGPYNNTGGPPSNAGFQGPGSFPGSAGSPAGAPPYQGPPPGSATPQYTASPAPSGSSTPGPGPPPNSTGFPPPPNSTGPPYNGPGPSPFGSPSGGPPQFVGRPGSSGPPFVGPPGGGNPHFPSPGQPFGGPQYGMPPGSPFGPGGHPMAGPMGPGHPMMGPAGAVERMDQALVNEGPNMPGFKRHTPYFNQPDYRLYELNKRLQQRTEESDNLWWDAFANEFFEDDATLTLTFCLEDGPKRYTIGRTLIPRYFRSIFEGGVTELYYNMKHPKESFHTTSITLDCEHCVMVTHHRRPMYAKVCTEGRLILEFTFDDLMRIKSWHMSVRSHRELVPRSMVGGMQQDPTVLEQLSKNITRQGITNSTLNYLRLCVILEPMQELMSRHKAYAMAPRDCLNTTLFRKWQLMCAPPESQRPASKRRKRKGSTSGPGNNAPPAPSKKRSPGPNFNLASQDVMVVGEPSLMGGEFGDEDERLITRLENTQYDAANSLDPHSHDTSGGPPPHSHQFHSEPTPGNSWPPDRGPGPPQGGPGSQGVQGTQSGGTTGVQGSQDASQQQQDKKSPAVSQ